MATAVQAATLRRKGIPVILTYLDDSGNQADFLKHSESSSDAIEPRITAIVPARNEEAVIATCVESLAKQPEVTEIIVVDDQSTDGTAAVVRQVAGHIPKMRLIEANEPPAGWVGKNYALALGAQQAKTDWLLFTDADVQLLEGAAARALQLAQENNAALVSFSPEQVTKTWYEKALIPLVYCRLARRFSFTAVNDPKSPVAAANGQFLMIRRDAYDAVGGHAQFPGEVLEDITLAAATKLAGYRVWFGSGSGIARARMYQSFGAMWEGWKKNLYRLMGGTTWKAFREVEAVFPWAALVVICVGFKFPLAMFVAVLLLLFRQTNYGSELVRNQYPLYLIIYYVPAVFLYVGVLFASYRAHARGAVQWKEREYKVQLPGQSK